MCIVPPGPLQGVSVYGSLCTGTCSQGPDNFYYCEVPPHPHDQDCVRNDQAIIPTNLNSTLISRCLTEPQSLVDQSQAALTLTSPAPMTAGEVDHIEGADSNGITVFATLMLWSSDLYQIVMIIRKRGDNYYWCQQGGGRPWAYCSPPLVFQNSWDHHFFLRSS